MVVSGPPGRDDIDRVEPIDLAQRVGNALVLFRTFPQAVVKHGQAIVAQQRAVIHVIVHRGEGIVAAIDERGIGLGAAQQVVHLRNGVGIAAVADDDVNLLSRLDGIATDFKNIASTRRKQRIIRRGARANQAIRLSTPCRA